MAAITEQQVISNNTVNMSQSQVINNDMSTTRNEIIDLLMRGIITPAEFERLTTEEQGAQQDEYGPIQMEEDVQVLSAQQATADPLPYAAGHWQGAQQDEGGLQAQATETQHNTYITAHALNNTDLSNSTILNCEVKQGNQTISNKRRWFIEIAVDIWANISHGKFRLSSFNSKETDEKGIKGYHWKPSLQLSVQHKSAQLTMKEIIHMVNINDLNIDITIKLKSGVVVRYKN